ncbi:MAG TPA: DNA polymerase/3'-5' exonuclease PolX [Candidatus Binatia bacterium]|nr:DNA polymerase/3'-5' exonuclease PolX [Candidatus Binatia bacterium]
MKKAFSNREIAAMMREMAAFYEMEGVPFKPQAYEQAADGIASADVSAESLFKTDGVKGLRRIPGVGEGIAGHIKTLFTKGTFPEYARFKKKYPFDALALTSIEGIGPKTALAMYKALKVRTLKDLERAARAGKIADVPHYGAKAQEHILKGLGIGEEDGKRTRGPALIKKEVGERKILGFILPLARGMEERLRAVAGVQHAVVCGSVRRRQETIGDLDFIVTTSQPKKVMDAFASFPEVARVLERGGTMTTVRLANGMHADVRVVPDGSFGAAVQYFTGDKDHGIKTRKMAIKKGLKLNEYGLWRGKRKIASRTEEDVYRALGLPYIEPELRTDTGEIEAAKAGTLPKVIGYDAMRGDLQVQTDWSDGAGSIADMAAAASELGYEYMAVTDHTKALAMTGGLNAKRLAQQARAIEAFNRRSRSVTVLKGIEADILKDGSLSLSGATLARLDFVGASVHSHFRLSREQQTARIIEAMKDPNVDAIFHPTGRKINKREPAEVDMEALLKAAKATGTAMEIDAYPDRSDLKDKHVRMAVALGVKLVIDTDAHEPAHMRYMDNGIAIARRGWAERKDVLNARPLKELLQWLRKPKKERR